MGVINNKGSHIDESISTFNEKTLPYINSSLFLKFYYCFEDSITQVFEQALDIFLTHIQPNNYFRFSFKRKPSEKNGTTS